MKKIIFIIAMLTALMPLKIINAVPAPILLRAMMAQNVPASGGSGGWTPPASQIFYVDSDTISGADNSDVNTWADTAGGFNLTASGTSQKLFNGILNGHAVVVFSQPGSYSSTLTAASSAFTFAVVFNSGSAVPDQTFFDGNSGGGNTLDINSSHLRLLKGSVSLIGQTTTTISPSTWYAVLATYDGAGNYAFYINSTTSSAGDNGSVSPPSFTSSLTTVVGISSGGNVQFVGEAAQFRKFNAALSSADIAGWFSTVSAKYAITLH